MRESTQRDGLDMEPPEHLIGTVDAHKWAEEFVVLVTVRPDVAKNLDTMRTWFARAISAGYDARREEEASLSD